MTTVKTNNVPRDLVSWHDLPAGVAAEWFDYVTDEDERYSYRFVEYRGSWYDTSDTEGFAPADIPGKWDLYLTDSFFSGIVFRFVEVRMDVRIYRPRHGSGDQPKQTPERSTHSMG